MTSLLRTAGEITLATYGLATLGAMSIGAGAIAGAQKIVQKPQNQGPFSRTTSLPKSLISHTTQRIYHRFMDFDRYLLEQLTPKTKEKP